MRIPLPATFFLLVIFIGFLSDAAAQDSTAWKDYRVQPGHNYSLQSKNILSPKKKKNLENNIADFYLYRNGVLVKPPKKVHYDFFPAGCLCFKYDDTLLLNSGLGASVGVGVGIKIYQGKFTGSLHANKNNQQIYKFSKDDSIYLNSILAEPETQSLRLYKKPDFLTNEIVIGEYRATYKKFYQKNEKDKDEPCRYTVKIIFKCRVTGGVDSIKSLSGMAGH